MKPPSDYVQRVFPTSDVIRNGGVNVRLPRRLHRGIEGYDELMVFRLLGNDPHRKDRLVYTRSRPNEPGERLPKLHRGSQRDVVVEMSVCATPLVPWVSVRPDIVVVWAIVRSSRVRREDRDRCRVA